MFREFEKELYLLMNYEEFQPCKVIVHTKKKLSIIITIFLREMQNRRGKN